MGVERPKTIHDLIERWENVERVLATMPLHERRKHWLMSTWGKRTACGTIACAAGHCGLDPWFRRRGFKMELDPDGHAVGPEGQLFPELVADFFYPSHERYDLYRVCSKKNIFWNGKERPVSQVLREVRSLLRRLRAYRDRENGTNPSRQGTV